MLRELRPSQRLPGGTFGTTRQNPLALVLIAGLAILLAVLYGYWRRTVRAKRPGSGRLNAITPQLGVVVAVAAIGFQLVGGTALAAPSVKSVTTATIPSSHGYDVGIRPATFRDSMAPHALAPRREERLQAVAASAASGVAAEGISPTVGELRAAGQADAHHIIQDAAVRDVPGYKTNSAPGIQLEGGGAGTPHQLATNVQRTAGIGGTYGSERQVACMALAAAGCSPAEISGVLARADAYFMDEFGLTFDSPLRIPGNRSVP